jgi:hypothetical protein
MSKKDLAFFFPKIPELARFNDSISQKNHPKIGG